MIWRFVPVLVLMLSGCITEQVGPSRNERASDVNVQLGLGYMQQGDMQLANEKLRKAIVQNPESSNAHNAYAILQERLGENEKAEEQYLIALELDPEDSQVNNNYGTFLCRNQREAESEKFFLAAIKNPLYKTPEYAWTNAAICLGKIGQSEKEYDYLREAVNVNPSYAPALYRITELEFDLKQYQRARFYLSRYFKVRNKSAESLWLAIRIELELDNKDNAYSYGLQLENNFPESELTKEWLSIK